jgi:hypothetical protein
LADDYDDLWDGTLDATFNFNENGDTYTGFVFTGSSWPGTIAVHRPSGSTEVKERLGSAKPAFPQ